MQMNGRTTIQKRWTDGAGRQRLTVITWDHEGARQEVKRLERVLDARDKSTHNLNLSSKEKR